MKQQLVLDHVAMTVPDLDGLVDKLESVFGLMVDIRSPQFALLTDPHSGLKLELGRSQDTSVHFRHLGFCTEDVDAMHTQLVASGLQESVVPQRRDFAHMYTSFLKQPDGFEIQLVKYD